MLIAIMTASFSSKNFRFPISPKPSLREPRHIKRIRGTVSFQGILAGYENSGSIREEGPLGIVYIAGIQVDDDQAKP